MKRILYLLSFAFLLLFTSCGGSSGSSQKSNEDVKKEEKITVKGADGTEYESYQECCSMNDYDAARRYLTKMENEYHASGVRGEKAIDKINELQDASKYIFKQEALYLMSMGDEDTMKRILYLIKEDGANNDQIAMLIDLAIERDDVDFVKKLANQYDSHCNDEKLKRVIDYLGKNNYYDNIVFIKSFLQERDKESLLFDLALLNNDEETLIYFLEKLEAAIPNRPALGLVKSDYYGKLDEHYRDYIEKVKECNSCCLQILNVAIKTKNHRLAKRAVGTTKPNIVGKDLGDWETVVVKSENSSVYNAFQVNIDNTDISNIKAKYQEAIKRGAFK